MNEDCFIKFNTSVEGISLPDKFTFPFYYEPHPLSKIAAEELKLYLASCEEWKNCFGRNDGASDLEVGKMFGVLVVQNSRKELGYIRAYSGKIIDSNVWPGFAPPLFNIFEKGSRFEKVSLALAELTTKIEQLTLSPDLENARLMLKNKADEHIEILKLEKRKLKEAQLERRKLRAEVKGVISDAEFDKLVKTHNQESINLKFMYKSYSDYLKQKLMPYEEDVAKIENELASVIRRRKEMSKDIQAWLFEKYNFLNAEGEYKNVVDIFKNTIAEIPPSGAGDCAAPKLLQFAFKNNLKPLAMAEFWWGKSPPSAVRKHGYFYPSCRGKCEPILNHMLKGMIVDPNPMLINPAIGKSLQFIYEDEYIAVINKPAEFLSVPGKNITDSVQERMKEKYPESTGPLIVHRLDMSTSGLLVVAKNKDVHKNLQEQFLKRTVKKRYVALLDGIVEGDGGYIDLPLRVDLDNRPCQMVCFEHGKSARTRWEVIDRIVNKTRVYFYPITGRTHQLRMHAAHYKGLNAPIVGDDLYGMRAERLHLHAEQIIFIHPVTKQEIVLKVEAEF